MPVTGCDFGLHRLFSNIASVPHNFCVPPAFVTNCSLPCETFASFVRELSTKQDCTAIVHAIGGLARDLGMATTAEGVETQEYLNLLRAEGCTEIQGYLISPPIPAGAVPALLSKYNSAGLRAFDRAGQLPRAS